MKNFLFFFIYLSFFLNSCNQNLNNTPNFILILSDDQGWSGTSVQMSEDINSSKSNYFETPSLKKLSSNGMKFSRGYSAAPVCSPSRYSIQFGQTPARLNMIRVGMNTSHIDHENPNTIPKILKKLLTTSVSTKISSMHF